MSGVVTAVIVLLVLSISRFNCSCFRENSYGYGTRRSQHVYRRFSLMFSLVYAYAIISITILRRVYYKFENFKKKNNSCNSRSVIETLRTSTAPLLNTGCTMTRPCKWRNSIAIVNIFLHKKNICSWSLKANMSVMSGDTTRWGKQFWKITCCM
jgi:hypothetical protein